MSKFKVGDKVVIKRAKAFFSDFSSIESKRFIGLECVVTEAKYIIRDKKDDSLNTRTVFVQPTDKDNSLSGYDWPFHTDEVKRLKS